MAVVVLVVWVLGCPVHVVRRVGVLVLHERGGGVGGGVVDWFSPSFVYFQRMLLLNLLNLFFFSGLWFRVVSSGGPILNFLGPPP